MTCRQAKKLLLLSPCGLHGDTDPRARLIRKKAQGRWSPYGPLPSIRTLWLPLLDGPFPEVW